MRRTWSLALRNLRRNRRRSLTTLIAMVIGAVTILVFGGYSRDITYSLQTSYVLRSGHLQIERKDYFLAGGQLTAKNLFALGCGGEINEARMEAGTDLPGGGGDV